MKFEMKKFAFPFKKKIASLAFVLVSALLFGAEVSQERQVRFSLWAATDVYPGYFDSDNASDEEKALNKESNSEVTYSVPVKKIKELAPFIVEGMVYGWKFDYTPSDKARSVKEYFEFTPVRELSEAEKANIKFAKPWIKDDVLSAWVEYRRTEAQIHSYNAWMSVLHPRIRGVGYARLAEGFDGIKKACEESIKNAVREYERTQIKTKPKEITGTVLVSEPPKIGIDAGRYKVLLDFFLESDRIIEYKTF